MKYLFIGAHTDEELCFAGTMYKFIEQGHEVDYLALSWCDEDSLLYECQQSADILKVRVSIEKFNVRRFSEQREGISKLLYNHNYYDVITTHSIIDIHPDHRTTGEESLRVFKGNLLTYTGPWNGKEDANYFVELSQKHLEMKMQALACYKSQSHRAYMNPEFIRSWAIYNGIKCGKKYAEGFHTQRLIV